MALQPCGGGVCSAAMEGSVTEEGLLLLLRAGACIESADAQGSTPLHCAVAVRNRVGVQYVGGQAEVRAAAQMHSVWCGRHLLAHGADIHARDCMGRAPATLAAVKVGGAGGGLGS